MSPFPELLSLAVILVGFLAVSSCERLLLLTPPGFLATLALLPFAYWHREHFAVPLPVFRRGEKNHRAPFGVLLLGLLFLGLCLQVLAWRMQVDLWFRYLHLLLLVPLAEEYYFRGILLDYLTKSFGRWGGAAAVTLFSALLHLPAGGGAYCSALVLSVLTCGCMLRWGVLSMAVAVHIAWNALFLYSDGPASADARPLFLLALVVVPVTMALVVLYSLYRGVQKPPVPGAAAGAAAPGNEGT